MNTTQAPFDDIHVRRAMNWIIDKAALRQIWGGPTVGDIANHIVPDSIFGGAMPDYRPYGTPGDHGSVAKAKAAMRGSKYSSGGGMCDAKECKGVLLIADARSVDPGMVSTIQQDAAKIGITFTVRTINGAYPTVQTVAKNVPMSERPGWGKDYADAVTFFSPLFDGRTIIPTGNTNYSLIGITKSQCTTLKVVGDCDPYNAKTGLGVPSIQKQLDKCSALIDPARTSCYEALDKYLMTNVVPWVPWMWSKVTHHEQQRHPLPVRPVLHHPGIRADLGEGLIRPARRVNDDPGAPARAPGVFSAGDTGMVLYIVTPAVGDPGRERGGLHHVPRLLQAPERRPRAPVRREVPDAREHRADQAPAAPRPAVLRGVFLLREELRHRRRERLARVSATRTGTTSRSREIIQRAPRTLFLIPGAAIIWLFFGVTIGVISAVRRRTAVDRAAMGFALFGITAPVFWLGLMALYMIWKKLGLTDGLRATRRLTDGVGHWFVAHDPALVRAGAPLHGRSTRG